MRDLQRVARLSGPPSWDPRWSVVGTLAFVVLVVATPLGAWPWLALQGAVALVAIALLKLPAGWLLRRAGGVLVFIAVLVGLLSAGHPVRAELGWAGAFAALLARSGLAVLGVIVLGGIEPMSRLLLALRRLGLPAVMVATLHFMYRYLHVLGEERDRMSLARRSRTFRRAGPREWLALSGLVGGLLLRALERGERVLAAMKARGWDGTLNGLQGHDA